MSKHTPGEWIIDGELIMGAIDTPDENWICQMNINKCENGEANARLIAESPSLLKALEDLINCHTGADWQTPEIQRKYWTAAQDTIRKARGE